MSDENIARLYADRELTASRERKQNAEAVAGWIQERDALRARCEALEADLQSALHLASVPDCNQDSEWYDEYNRLCDAHPAPQPGAPTT